MIKFLRLKRNVLLSSEYFIIILGFLSIFPFIPISFFNNPSIDDFCFFVKTIEKGYWNSQIEWYSTWTGRYFSTAILSIYPLLTKSFLLYKIVPLILLGLFFLATYILILIFF